LNRPEEDPAARARKYITTLTRALRKTKTRTGDASVAGVNIRKVIDATQRYLRDAKHYLHEGRPSTSLASVAYAEGLLDALIFLKLTTDEVPPEAI